MPKMETWHDMADAAWDALQDQLDRGEVYREESGFNDALLYGYDPEVEAEQAAEWHAYDRQIAADYYGSRGVC